MTTPNPQSLEGLIERGWGYLRNSPKFHYFDRHTGMSACGRWMRLGSMDDLEDSNDDSLENCSACRRKVKKIRALTAMQDQNNER
jgi:hypothetical protein